LGIHLTGSGSFHEYRLDLLRRQSHGLQCPVVKCEWPPPEAVAIR
jgi:hypothetical protein